MERLRLMIARIRDWFGPRHTVESVTKELIRGLEDGSVVLHSDEPKRGDP